MAFKFWANEQMTEVPGSPTSGGTPLQSVFFDVGGAAHQDFVLYFGSPQRSYNLQTRVNSGIDAVTLTPAAALPERENQTAYEVGAVVSDGAGNIHRCIAAGTSGETAPNWLKQRGGRTSDGGVVWHCLGEAYQPAAVRLALSAAGLDSAQAGAPLALGATVRGGAAVAVHVRIANSVSDRYDAPFSPQISLNINDCVEVEAAP